jgi:DNA-binding transcriptional regulator YhcF (GntR family)
MGDSLRRAKRRRRYAEVPEALLFDPKISSHAKTAWGILDRHIDNRVESLGTETEGVAFPSRATLAGYMGVSLDTVDRALAELRLAGWLSTTARGQGRTALNELHDEPDAAQARLQETARARRQEAARARSPKKNGPKDNEPKGTNPLPPASGGPAAPEEGPARPSSSSRPFPRAEGLNGSADAGLTPGGTPANTLPNSAELSEALTRRLFEQAERPLGRNVRTVKPVVTDLLTNGFSPEAIERAALSPTARAWTYEALAYGIRQAETAGQRPGGRPRKAAPPVVHAPAEARREQTAEERADIERIKAELKQKLADKRAAKEAARREQDAAERPTLGAPAEEVPA